MDETEYRRLVLKTESPVDPNKLIRVDYVRAVLQLVIQVGKLLDLVKKEVFYGKEISEDAVLTILRNMVKIADVIYDARVLKARRLPVSFRLLHGVLGNASEVCELVDSLDQTFEQKKGVPTKDILFNVKEELGDQGWYQALLYDHLVLDPAEIRAMNIAKLKARYGDKFTQEAAENRDYVKERLAAEKAIV